MASAVPIDEGYSLYGYGSSLEPPESTSSTWMDQLRAIQGGAYGVGAGLAGAVETVLTDPLGPELPEKRYFTGLRESAEAGQRAAYEAMTPQGRRNVEASLLPREGQPDIFDPDVSTLSKVGSLVGGGVPSVAASILGTVVGGPLLGLGAAGAMEAGAVYNEVRSRLQEMSDEELSEKSDIYAGLRSVGFSEKQARDWLLQESARNRALITGVIGAATSRFGAEGIASRALSGAGLKGGVAKRAGTGALAEGVTEGAQEGLSEYQAQAAIAEAVDPDAPTDWYALANKVLEGMAGGAPIGAGVGALSRDRETPQVDPSVALAVNRAPTSTPTSAPTPTPAQPAGAPPVVPEASPPVVPEASPVPIPAGDPQVQAATTQASTTQDVPVVSGVPVDPSIVAAIAPTSRVVPRTDEELGELEPDELAPLPVPRILDPVTQAAIGAPPEVAVQPPEPPPPPASDIEARVRAEIPPLVPGPAPTTPLPPEVSDPDFNALIEELRAKGQNNGQIIAAIRKRSEVQQRPLTWTQATELVTPGGSRERGALLPESELEKRAKADVEEAKTVIQKRDQPRMTEAKKAQIAAGEQEILRKREAQQREKQRGYDDAARRFRQALQETPPPPADADLKTLRAHVAALTTKAGIDSKTPLPAKFEGQDPALALLKTLRSMKVGTLAKLREYVATEAAFRGGDEAVAVETRKAQAAPSTPELQETPDETSAGRIAAGLEVGEQQALVEAMEDATARVEQRAEQAGLTPEEAERAAEYAREAAARAQATSREESRRIGMAELIDPAAAKTARERENAAKREALARQEEKAKAEEAARKAETTKRAAEAAQEAVKAKEAQETKPKRAVEIVKKRKVVIPPKGAAPKSGVALKNLPVPKTPAEETAQVVQAVEDATVADDIDPTPIRRAVTPGTSAEVFAEKLKASRLRKVFEQDVFKKDVPGNVRLRGSNGSVTVQRKYTFDEVARFVNVQQLPPSMRESFKFFTQELQDLTQDVDVYLADQAQISTLIGPHMAEGTGGYYQNNKIVLNKDFMRRSDGTLNHAVLAHLLVHEASHHALQSEIELNSMARTDVENFMAALKRVLAANDYPSALKEYGFTNAHEFIAEAVSNPSFQRLLASIDVPPDLLEEFGYAPRAKPSMWDLFVNLMGRILGSSPDAITALDIALRHTENLFAGARQTNRALGLGDLRRSPGSLREAPIPPVRLMQASPRNFIADTRESLRGKGTGIRLLPTHYLAERYDRLFKGNPIRRALDVMNKMEVRSNEEMKKDIELAEEWRLFERDDPQEGRRAAEVATKLTMANMNPIDRAGATFADLLAANQHFGGPKSTKKTNYAARANLERLQAEFMALKPETRKLILKVGKHFRDSQNTRTRMLAGKIISLSNTNLSIQMVNDIADRTVTGKLTEEDKENIGDDNLFKALQDAQEVRLIDGLYVPLLRHGNHVVLTMDRVGNLHGGKLEGKPGLEDIIEFRAADEKTAEAMLKAFTSDPDNARIAMGQPVGTRRYMGGKIVSEAEARGQPHEFAYRMRLNRRGTYMFDTKKQAETFRRENAGEFQSISKRLKRRESEGRGELTSLQVAAIGNAIDRSDASASAKSMLRNLVDQASVMQLTGNRIQQRSLPRRNIKGASLDIPRNILSYGQTAGHATGRLAHLDDLRKALKEMKTNVDDDPFDKDRDTKEKLITELEKRFNESSLDTQAPPGILKDILTTTYLTRLASVAYNVVNATQPGMSSLPKMAARYGQVRAMVELFKAYDTIASTPLVGQAMANMATAANPQNWSKLKIDTNDLVGHVKNRLKGDPALAAIEFADAQGKMGDSASHEVAAAVAGQSSYRKALATADRVFRQMAQAIEVMNRSVVLVSTYRLATAKGASHDEAVEQAYDMMISTQGDYSFQNNPSFFKKVPGMPAFQFKKYAVMQGALLHDMIGTAFKGASPQQRKAAAKHIGNMLIVQMLAAGAMGLPGLELLRVGMIAFAALGLSEGYEEWERRARAFVEQGVGKTWAELLSSGILSRAIGLDLSKTLSLSDMVTYGEPNEYDKDGLAAYVAGFVGGAPAGMIGDWAQGARDISKGDIVKGLEKIVPVKAVADVVKAGRRRAEGELTNKEALLTGLGFSPSRIAEKNRQVGDRVAASRAKERARKDLERRYREADQDELPALKREIEKHNKEVGSFRQRVAPKALDRIRRQTEQERRELAR